MIDLQEWALKNSYKIAWGSMQCLSESLNQLEEMFQAGELNELQSNRLKEWIAYDDYKIQNRKSIILVAHSVIGKTRRLIFDFNGTEITALLPPTYGDGGANQQYENEVEKNLASYLAAFGHKVERLAGPYKNLAARSGLGKFGRNNLIYVDGFGSYIRIVGFVTDAELNPEIFPEIEREKQILETCGECNLCERSCPTHAIRADRFLLHVNRCLAYQNSRLYDGHDLQSAKNDCLVGCITCQNQCPHNKAFIGVGSVLSEHFTQAESDYILKGSDMVEEIGTRVYEKLGRLGLLQYREFIFRNIRNHIHTEHVQ